MASSNRTAIVVLVFLATFTDILAYSIAVPVLPDLSARLGASPTIIGLLFASFGVTLLATSIPMGAVSDRIGRRVPMLIGLAALTGSSLLFALSDRLQWLFAARMIQGAADAITWVVGLALVADLYGPHERGRIAGAIMSGPGLAFMLGPSIGGWLYEVGGIRLPFMAVAGLSFLVLVGFALLPLETTKVNESKATVWAALREADMLKCLVVVVAASGTIAMLEPVLVFRLTEFRVTPGRVGMLFGIAALATALLNPIYGRLADRFGPSRLMLMGLVLAAVVLPFLGRTTTFTSAAVVYTLEAAGIAMVITPSLSFMAEAASRGGNESFGLAYGLYNVGWGIGLLAGPALGGFMFEAIGFRRLATNWVPVLLAAAVVMLRPALAVRGPVSDRPT